MNNKNVDYIVLNTKNGVNKNEGIGFHPATTLFLVKFKTDIN